MIICHVPATLEGFSVVEGYVMFWPRFKAAVVEGYYIVWERCCRNLNAVNIVNPLGTGMKYVLEIPPLWKNGRIFKNSSPTLFRPLSDYACINQLYYIEFTGESFAILILT